MKAIKTGILFFLWLVLFTAVSTCKKETTQNDKGEKDYPISPVSFTAVQISDEFWLPRIEINQKITIPFANKKNEETGRVDNFAIGAGLKEGKFTGRRFNDTDVYKVIEGIAYTLQVHPDSELEEYTDGLIELIAASQEKDGYLYPARTADPENPAPGAGPERWSRLRGSHELYNCGHMYEAAVAYFQATGKRAFLDVAVKNADMLVRTFGPDKRRDVPGHQEIEIGLAKLYRITGKKEYLDLSKFFLDERGQPHDGGLYPEDTPFALYNGRDYMQDRRGSRACGPGHLHVCWNGRRGRSHRKRGLYPGHRQALGKRRIEKTVFDWWRGCPSYIRGLRRQLRAAQQLCLHGNMRCHRERVLEPSHVPSPWGSQVHRCYGTGLVQRPDIRRLPGRGLLFLPESPGVQGQA
jgi:hypothetical protein